MRAYGLVYSFQALSFLLNLTKSKYYWSPMSELVNNKREGVLIIFFLFKDKGFCFSEKRDMLLRPPPAPQYVTANQNPVGGYNNQPLACIHMGLRNASSLIIASGHHWEREMNRQKPEPLVHCICWLFPANQKANHKHWIVFSAYRVGVALHCALHNAVSNDDLHIVCNAFWTAFLFL